ncbi:MAG TPA: sugar phosphate isomerase/epimerase family protein [Methylomirabilota bacterium]|nr:sugar phosphate isomerase/epimerase family protein [Methylomirabilota bacterium]
MAAAPAAAAVTAAARFRLGLCNEVLRDMEFAAQCAYAAALGYDGLEVAPFTLGTEPHRLGAEARQALRRAAADAGLAVVGLHWLLVTPAGLTLTGPDAAARARTVDVMRRLVGLCADLGGRVLVHGSPAQRTVAAGDDPAAALARARDALAAVAPEAEAAGVVYCLEPLARGETNFVNTVAEAAALVQAVGSPAVRTMLDTSACARAEAEPAAAVLERWLPTGLIAHVQVNDANRRGPGQGGDRFAGVLAALRRHRYAGVISVEPFEYVPDGRGCAARAIGYLRGLEESLAP